MVNIGGRAHNIDEVTKVCKLGYPFVEINFNDPVQIKSELLVRLNEIKEKYGVFFLAHFPNEGNPSDLANLQKIFLPKIMSLIELCPKLEIKQATIHFWMDRRMQWTTDKIISQKLDLLSKMVGHADKFGLTICLENLSCRYDDFQYFFTQIPMLEMTMDIGHGQLLTDENTSFGFIEHLFDKIRHIHVHDNLGGNKVTDDLHLPLGEGIIDYPKIFSILNRKGYDSTITMEVATGKMKETQAKIEAHFS